jgi:putative transposase
MISTACTHSRNVKNGQGGQMALRWCAAGMTEAGQQSRRVDGHMHLAALRRPLDEHTAAAGLTFQVRFRDLRHGQS